MHGDYRLGNLALDPRDPGRVAAIFDWEMATLGDPLADLGYTLIYWTEPGDAASGGSPFGASVTAQPGFATRAELVEAYARATGRDVAAIDFYQVLALYKLAVISEGIYARFQMGKTLGPGFENMQRAAGPLARARARAGERVERRAAARLSVPDHPTHPDDQAARRPLLRRRSARRLHLDARERAGLLGRGRARSGASRCTTTCSRCRASRSSFCSGQSSRPDAPPIPSMINLDDPAHRRRRGLVSRGFTPRRVGDHEREDPRRSAAS